MGGTMYDTLIDRTRPLGFVQEYLAGQLTREKFQKQVDQRRSELSAAGLSGWDIKKLSMFPPDQRSCAQGLLQALHSAGLVSDPTLCDVEFQEFRNRMAGSFEHLPDRHTYIFPDEARGAFELSMAIHPKNVVVCGAYYNYLAVWLVSGLSPGGSILCLDIDESVSRVGQRNMEAMGLTDRVVTKNRDAEAELLEGQGPIDLLVIDATGPGTHPDPRYHGKSIYGPLLAAARSRLTSGAYVLAHNADQGSPDLEEFYAGVAGASFAHYLGTTDDLAVFRL